jgi:phage tail protein X
MKRSFLRRHLLFFLFTLSVPFLFNPLNADEAQLVRVRKGDTVSYLSFKIYGMYDPRIGEFLRQENPKIKDINLIYAGQELRFPKPAVMKKWLSAKTVKPVEPTPVPLIKESPPQQEIFPPGMQVRANKGVITYLDGQVQVKKGGNPPWSPAHPNQILYGKDEIKVFAKSRAELILDNQSVMRLSENTVLTLHQLEEDPVSQKETTRMGVSFGKLWTRATKLFNPASRLEVRTPTAIAGVQGTTYQVSVMDERSTTIQVFEGAVKVYNPFPPPQPSPPGPTTPSGAPQEVRGPVEVPGPTAVSREEWTQIVLRQFQQITVTDRDISRPISFNINQERQNEWIRWNEERDSDFQPPERPR